MASKKNQTSGVPWRWLAEVSMHPLQMEIYKKILKDGITSPKDLSDVFGESIASVCYHVSKLEKHGLIVLDHTEPVRGSLKHFYRAATIPKKYKA